MPTQRFEQWNVVFWPFWGAKMTKIGIQNPKLIVTNDYKQFLAHFEWFLSLFQISNITWVSAGQAKSTQKWYFLG